jgi:hypothetical protein
LKVKRNGYESIASDLEELKGGRKEEDERLMMMMMMLMLMLMRGKLKSGGSTTWDYFIDFWPLNTLTLSHDEPYWDREKWDWGKAEDVLRSSTLATLRPKRPGPASSAETNTETSRKQSATNSLQTSGAVRPNFPILLVTILLRNPPLP